MNLDIPRPHNTTPADEIYDRALTSGITFECSCADITEGERDELMKGATRANKDQVEKIIALWEGENFRDMMIQRNPCKHLKTETHFVFIHSATEYFFSIN